MASAPRLSQLHTLANIVSGTKFDHKVLEWDLVYELLERGHKITQTIHQHGTHCLIGTDQLVLKDFCKMLAPGTSLDKFLASNGFPGKLLLYFYL